jgi:hypothetical protein
MPPAPSTAQRRSGKRFAQRSRVRSPLRLAAKVSCPTNSPCSSFSTRQRLSPYGDLRRSLSPCLAPSSFALGTTASWRAEDNPTLSKIHASVGPPRSPFSTAGRRPRTSQLSCTYKGGMDFASDPYRRPRSLQRLQTTELLLTVKQVGTSVNKPPTCGRPSALISSLLRKGTITEV